MTAVQPTPTFPVGRWRARWIWAPAPDGLHGRRTVALRRDLDLGRVPTHLPVRVCADSRYVLLVNGVEVRRGPTRGNPRRRRTDVVDLAPHLQLGTNVIAALVTFYGTPRSWWMPMPMSTNGIQQGAFVLEAHPDAPVDLVTDGAWVGRHLPGWVDGEGSVLAGRHVEVIDTAGLPEDWATGPARDGWDPAVLLHANATGEPGPPGPPSYPLGALPAAPLPAPTPQPVPLSQVGGDPTVWLADRIVVGPVELDVEGPPGGRVELRFGELVDDGGLRSGPDQESIGVVVHTDGTRRRIRTVDTYGVRGVWASAEDGVTVHGLDVVEMLHPVRGEASFTCSDPLLDRIWQVGRRTVSICSLDAYVDCPTREQRAWTGDAVVHQMVDLTTNADWSMAAWYPHLAASPRADGMLPMAVAGDAEISDIAVIPDWALHWVHGVHNLHRYIGDRDEVARLLPVVEGVLRWFEPYVAGDDLPTDVVGWVIIDWSAIHTQGVSTPLVGLLGRALLEFAEMAEWLGDGGRAGWARAWHARLATAAERLWDRQREAYVTHAVDGHRQAPLSVHAQAAMVVGGLAPRDRWDRLVALMTDRDRHVHATHGHDGPAGPGSELPVGGPWMYSGHTDPWWDTDTQLVAAQPFFRYVVHDALAAAGRADAIVDGCRDWAAALERCGTSWTETWFGGTVSHGWSSTPTRDMVQRVLGVEPAEPGFAVARVQPALGDLTWARGTVPTPAGMLQVEVTADALTVDSPVPFLHQGIRHEPGSHVLARRPAVSR